MAEYRRSEIVSGTFILLAVLAFTLFAFQVGGCGIPSFLKAKTVRCVTFFPEVKTLEAGFKVSIGGQRVGKVESISLAAPGEVKDFWAKSGVPEIDRPEWAKGSGLDAQVLRIEFELESGRELRLDTKGARVVLMQEGFLGQHYLLLDPGNVATAKIVDDLEAPVRVVPKVAGGLEDLITKGGGLVVKLDEILETVKRMLAKVDTRILSESNLQQLDAIMADFTEATKSARAFAAQLPRYVDPNDPSSVDKQLIGPANALIENMNQSLDRVRNQLLDVTMVEVNKLLKDAQEAVADGRKVLANVDGAITENRPNFQRIVDDLAKTTSQLDGRLDAMQQDLQKLLRNTDGAVTDVRAIMAENRPELLEVMQGLRRTLWEVEVLSRKIRANPAVLIFGDDEPILSPQPVDETQLRQSGRARPFNQREEGRDR